MKPFYLLLLGAVLLPGIIHAVSIRTTDNRVYNNVRLVKVTASGLVFKYRHRRSEYVTLKPEELDPDARADYAKQIEIYNSIHNSKQQNQDKISDRQQHYFNMQVERLRDPDPVKHLQLLVRLRDSFNGESAEGAKCDFSVWRKKVNSIFQEYENRLLKMSPMEAFDQFNRDREECRKFGMLEEEFTSLWEKMAVPFVQKFPEELEKLNDLPLESVMSYAEKLLVVYKDLSVDLGKIHSVIEAKKMDFSILNALKVVDAGSDHAAEIASLENLINLCPQHPKIPELKKLKAQHEYNLQVKNDLAQLTSLYSKFSENPVDVLRVMEKAVKAYSDSLYAGELAMLLADFKNKWKAEQVRQAAEMVKRCEEVERQWAEEECRRVGDKRQRVEEESRRVEKERQYAIEEAVKQMEFNGSKFKKQIFIKTRIKNKIHPQMPLILYIFSMDQKTFAKNAFQKTDRIRVTFNEYKKQVAESVRLRQIGKSLSIADMYSSDFWSKAQNHDKQAQELLSKIKQYHLETRQILQDHLLSGATGEKKHLRMCTLENNSSFDISNIRIPVILLVVARGIDMCHEYNAGFLAWYMEYTPSEVVTWELE